MKETTEFTIFVGRLLNAFFAAFEDKVINLADFQHLLPAIFAAQPGIEGFGKIGAENAAATIPQRDELNRTFLGAVPNVPPDQADNFARIFSGIFAAWREGYKLGRAELIEEIRGGTFDIGSVMDQE